MTNHGINVTVLSASDIEQRRGELLAKFNGKSLYDLRDMAYEYKLSLDELEVLRELERLEFLADR